MENNNFDWSTIKKPSVATQPKLPASVYRAMAEQEKHEEVVEFNEKQIKLLSDQNEQLCANFNKLEDLYRIKEKELEEAKMGEKKAHILNVCMMVISIVSMLISVAAWLLPDIINIPSKSQAVPLKTINIANFQNMIIAMKDFLFNFWKVITDYIAPLGDLCIVIITLIIFGFTYVSKKISIMSLGESFSVWEGYSINVTLKNATLSDMSVKKVKLIFDNKRELTINTYDTPVLIGPLKSVVFESPKHSKRPFDDLFRVNGHKIKAQITLADNQIIFAKMHKNLFKKPKNEKIYECPVSINYADGDKVITDHMLYKILIYRNEEFVTDIIVLKNGLMNQTIAGYNALPKEKLQSKEQVKSAVESLLKSKKFVVDVLDYSIENFHNRG